MPSNTRRFAVVLMLSATVACGGSDAESTDATCRPHPAEVGAEAHDKGPCLLEEGQRGGTQWALVGFWDKDPREGTRGLGPCVSMEIGGAGAGWCDLPAGRVVGEYASVEVTATTTAAFGPVKRDAVARVRLEFASGDPIEIRVKRLPWDGYAYWYATFDGRVPSALVGVDDDGREVSRESIPAA